MIINFLKDRYYFEIAGLELGLKKASIFYAKKKELTKYIDALKDLKYNYQISDLFYDYKDEKTFKKINEISSDDSSFSIYVSKDKQICKKIKKYDLYHQFSNETKELKKRDLFYEIGNLLGFPKCCSKFIIESHEKSEDMYKKFIKLSNNDFQDETIYKLLALKESKHVDYQLNNFGLNESFFGYYVCKYDCPNAMQINKQYLEYYKTNFKTDYEILIKELKKPILFFSSYRIITFDKIKISNNRIIYDNPKIKKEVFNEVNKKNIIKLRQIHKYLDAGNNFSINKTTIKIYKNDRLIFTYNKKFDLDGAFIIIS
jgi:hypothetical protein